jgi:hypothetical protein
MGPLLYGGMIFALFRYLKAGIGWGERMSLGGALFTSLYFVTLRISWDLYRNMLGLTFLLISLPLLENLVSRRREILLSCLIALTVAANQLTGVVVLFLVAVMAFSALLKNQSKTFYKLSRVVVPGAVIFFGIIYAGILTWGTSLVQEQPALPSLATLTSSIGFLGYAYLPLAPLVLLGSRVIRNRNLLTWSLFCFVAAIGSILPFAGPNASSYRWTLLLAIPLCVYASAGLDKLSNSSRSMISSLGSLKRRAIPLISTVLLLSAILYLTIPAQQAFFYYGSFATLLPTSMLQNTVPLSDMGSLQTLLRWVAQKMGPGSALITHASMYGWARAYLPTDSHIVNYGYSVPSEGLKIARLAGYSSIFMIWWMDGLGWHGQPNVAGGFVPVVQDGDLAVYTYD